MQLIQRIQIKGRIELLSGLHIGMGKDAIEIGGIDSPVVKHPHSGMPYIPGSSLKGKLRSLLEWHLGKLELDGNVWGSSRDGRYDGADPVLRIFGTTHKDWKDGPTRLLVRDAMPSEEWRKDIIGRGLPLTEEKFENNINRIQGKAGIGIRKIERVPAGALFDFEMVYRVFDLQDGGSTDRANLKHLLQALQLLELDALGGSGSRGYGRIRFGALEVGGKLFSSIGEAVAA
jgi:CRISPR-associated protein Csm3